MRNEYDPSRIPANELSEADETTFTPEEILAAHEEAFRSGQVWFASETRDAYELRVGKAWAKYREGLERDLGLTESSSGAADAENTSERPDDQEASSETHESLTQDEILAAHEDVFKGSQSWHANETRDEYDARVERLWLLKREQILQDLIARNSARPNVSEVPAEVGTESVAGAAQEEPTTDSDTRREVQESYADLANVRVASANIRSLLEDAGKYDAETFTKRATQIVYEMLTSRSSYVQETVLSGKQVADIMEQRVVEMRRYGAARDAIQGGLSARNMDWNSNPGWFGINTRPEVPSRKGLNRKVYATLPREEYTSIEHLPDLAEKLRQLALQTDDIIQVKMPNGYAGFVAHNDSIVIHFKKKESAELVTSVLNAWISEHGLHEAPREMGRTKLGIDSSDSSFSDRIANNIATSLRAHMEEKTSEGQPSFTNDALVRWAVKYAIEQSQVAPNETSAVE